MNFRIGTLADVIGWMLKTPCIFLSFSANWSIIEIASTSLSEGLSENVSEMSKSDLLIANPFRDDPYRVNFAVG